MNKKSILIIILIVIFLLSTSITLFVILTNLNTTRNSSKEEDTDNQVTPTSDETQKQNADILNRLSDSVTLVDFSALPRDASDFSSYKTYYVSTTGDDGNNGTLDKPFAKISHALEAADEKSIVFVRGGTYQTRNLNITHSNFTLATYEEEEVILSPVAQNDQWDMDEDLAILIEGDLANVVIDGFAINDFEEGIVYGDPQTQENIILKNINIINARIGISNAYPSHTKYLVEDLLIKNVTMTDITGIGLQCGDEQNKCAKDVLVQDVKVLGAENNEDDTGYDSLAMVESDNILVIDSTFTNAPGDGLDFKSTRVAVVNTIVGNPNRNGIKFWHEGEIINSIVYATGADAAVVFGSDKSGSVFRLVNSVVAQHLLTTPQAERHAYAITIGYDESKSYNVEIINNIFYDMPGPIYINSQSSIDIRNNIFYKFIHDDRFLVYGEDDLDNIEELNQIEYADQNLYIDPMFKDTSLSDWTLLQTSPAIDTGARNNKIPDFDINWKDRPIGSEVDIGPYEK